MSAAVRKDYGELDKSLVIMDMHEIGQEPTAILGVAIRSNDFDAFVRAVEWLAVDRFGGATFAELMEEDSDGRSASASSARYASDHVFTSADEPGGHSKFCRRSC